MPRGQLSAAAPGAGVPAAEVIAADDLVVARLLPLLDAHGVGLDVFRALRRLSDAAEGLTVGELGRLISATPPATTRVVDRLVTEGLAFRRADATDRRRVLVVASDAGRDLWRTLVAALDA
ncbi:MarR family transcriptional regulator [Pimelobacter simplex]|uniref:MarR family transcriptional regulator n=1 Tax=Nocardioides simplex TaxID=2045 RepID=UPI003AAB14D7